MMLCRANNTLTNYLRTLIYCRDATAIKYSTSQMKYTNKFLCCVPLGSETRIYKFPSRKFHSIEVGSRISKWETRNSASTPTSDSEIQVGKYEFPSPVECSTRCLNTVERRRRNDKNSFRDISSWSMH